MTHEEAIESLRECAETLRHIAKPTESLVSGVEMKHRKATEALKQPQEKELSLAEAIEKATKIYDDAVSKGNADFYYDRKHRNTTCVIRVEPTRQGGLVTYAVGRAWCSRYDQSVAVVGYAIAYLRALGREVPEWLLHIPQK